MHQRNNCTRMNSSLTAGALHFGIAPLESNETLVSRQFLTYEYHSQQSPVFLPGIPYSGRNKPTRPHIRRGGVTICRGFCCICEDLRHWFRPSYCRWQQIMYKMGALTPSRTPKDGRTAMYFAVTAASSELLINPVHTGSLITNIMHRSCWSRRYCRHPQLLISPALTGVPTIAVMANTHRSPFDKRITI